MARKLASKNTKELRSETEIREKGLQIGEYSPSWQGHIVFLNTEESFIAQKMGVDKPGEYALKVR